MPVCSLTIARVARRSDRIRREGGASAVWHTLPPLVRGGRELGAGEDAPLSEEQRGAPPASRPGGCSVSSNPVASVTSREASETAPFVEEAAASVARARAVGGGHHAGRGSDDPLRLTIVFGGRIWDALSAARPERVPMPAGAQDGIAAFAELVSYAIENAGTREELAASRARLVEAADLRLAGRDQPGLVGVDHGLDAVAQAELGE
jgi:hypothetical protein